MKNYFLLVVLIFAFFTQGFCQISEKAEPVSFQQKIKQQISFVNLQAQERVEEVSSKIERQPLYAGYKIALSGNESEEGVWVVAKSGWRSWRLGIAVDNAKGLNGYFQNVELAEGEQLFLYDQSKTTLLGAFTDFNNGQFLATGIIPGNKIVVEFNTKNLSDRLPFELVQVGVTVNDFNGTNRDFGGADFCEVLVNCPEGDDWKPERNGVARILISERNSLYWCSGTLVNNTSQDGKPYFLTANHCGQQADSSDYSKWVFYFNYESRDCEFPVLEPPHQTISGAKLLAHSSSSTSSGSDFKLLLLADDIPPEYEPYYSGWDRSGSGASAGVGIHHPEGDLKMISTYKDPLVSVNYNNPSPDANGKYWMVHWSETQNGHGVTEGGSSGSPIFSQGGYVVGLLSGGRASCTAQDEPDYYGKFSYSWESNGTDSTTQLKPWLDPLNLNVDRLPGYKKDTLTFAANFTASTSEIKVGGTVNFFNQSQGEIVGYEWYFEGGVPNKSVMEIPPTIHYSEVGEFDVMLIAKSTKSSDTLIVRDYIHVLPSLTPNPSAGHFSINFGQEMPQELDISITDVRGKNVNFFISEGFGNSVIVDLSQLSSGVYIIRVTADGSLETLKAMLITNSNFN
jgi:hypothetical protein